MSIPSFIFRRGATVAAPRPYWKWHSTTRPRNPASGACPPWRSAVPVGRPASRRAWRGSPGQIGVRPDPGRVASHAGCVAVEQRAAGLPSRSRVDRGGGASAARAGQSSPRIAGRTIHGRPAGPDPPVAALEVGRPCARRQMTGAPRLRRGEFPPGEYCRDRPLVAYRGFGLSDSRVVGRDPASSGVRVRARRTSATTGWRQARPDAVRRLGTVRQAASWWRSR